MGRRAAAFLVIVAMFTGAATAFAGELTLGRTRGQTGGEVTVPLTYRQSSGPAAAGMATDIRFDPKGLTQPRCAAGAALSSGQKSVKCAEPQPGLLRVAIYGLNLDPVPDGEVATVTFRVSPQARHGLYRLRHQPSAADAGGKEFTLLRHDGLIRVGPR